MKTRFLIVSALVVSVLNLTLPVAGVAQTLAPQAQPVSSIASRTLPNQARSSPIMSIEDVARPDGSVRPRNMLGSRPSIDFPHVPSAITNTQNVELVGHIGGTGFAVAVQGNYAYLGLGPELAVVDISNRANPWRVGYLVLPWPSEGGVYGVRKVAVSGSRAYVIGGMNDLWVVDVSNPANPSKVSHVNLPAYAQNVAVAGNYAYVRYEYTLNYVDYNGLWVIDMTIPANPRDVGHYETEGNGWSMGALAVAGKYVYIDNVVNGYSTLRIIDVSNPANPSEVSHWDMIQYLRGVAVAGGYAYVAGSADNGNINRLRVVDVSDPTSPREVGSCDTHYTNDMTVAGNTVYLASFDGLQVLDVSNPANPHETGYYLTLGSTLYMAVTGSIACIVGDYDLLLVDVSDPFDLREVGAYDTFGDVYQIAAASDYAYVAFRHCDPGCNSALRVVDVSTPSRPIAVGRYEWIWSSALKSVAVSGGYAYIAADDRGLRVVDVSDPIRPRNVGSPNYGGGAEAYGVAVVGGYAYVVGIEGLRVVDISNPISRTEVGFASGFDGRDVVVDRGNAYIASDNSGLHVVNVSNPIGPTEVGFYDTPGEAQGVAVTNGYAYVADTSSLRVIDVSDAANPTEVNHLNIAAVDIVIAEGYAYVADSTGLRVLDVSNPASPREVGYYSIYLGANISVAVAGGYAYVATGGFGLFILRFTGDIPTIQVDVTTFSGTFNGSSILVTATATLQNVSLLSATVTGLVYQAGAADIPLRFDMNDRGIDSDAIANDGIYSARITMLGPDDMPPGNYVVSVSAQKTQNGVVISGIGLTILTIYGRADGDLGVSLSLNCPDVSNVFIGDTCAMSASVRYPDGSIHSDGSVTVIAIEPNQQQTPIVLGNIGNNNWQANYTFSQAGRHLLDIRADPAPGSRYVSGYDSSVVTALLSRSPLVLSASGLAGTLPLRAIVPITVNVAVDGYPVSNVRVTAVVNPGQKSIDLFGQGGGTYVGSYITYDPGQFTAEFRASSSVYKPSTVSTTFSVSSIGVHLLSTIESTRFLSKHFLEKMKDEANNIATDGDWFAGKSREDDFKRKYDLALNIISLGIDSHELGKELSKSASQSTASIASEFPGVASYPWAQSQPLGSIDRSIYESWAKSVEPSLPTGLIGYLSNRDLPPQLSKQILRQVLLSYVAKVKDKTVEDVLKETDLSLLSNILATIMANDDSALSNRFYPAFVKLTDENIALASTTALSVSASLPPLSSDLENRLIDDLNNRTKANDYMWQDVHWQWRVINTARVAREQGEDLTIKFVGILFKSGTSTILLIIFPEPVSKVIGIAAAIVSLANDYIEDTKSLDSSEKMRALAYASMLSAETTAFRLSSNTIWGLEQIHEGVLPQTPQGRIVSINDISRGDHPLLGGFSERQVVSSIVIRNTGDTPTDYSIKTYYDRETGGIVTQLNACRIEDMRDPITGQKMSWVTLAPGQERTLEVVFLDKDDNRDMRPNEGDEISFVLTAHTLRGWYWADTQSHTFLPYEASVSAGIRSTSPVSLTFPHPISTRLARNKSGTRNTVRLYVDNPFPYPISAKVRQGVPISLAVLSANDGLVQNGAIQWRQVIPPHGSYEFAYTVRNDSTDRADIQVPAAELSFYVPAANADAVFTSVPLTITAPELSKIYLPVIQRDYAPPLLLQANFSASPTSGVVPLTVIFTNTSTGAYTSSLWDFGDSLTSTLPSPTHVYTTPGVYTVSLTVSRATGSLVLPGDTSTLTRANYITVGGVRADFVGEPTTGVAPLAVVFTNTSSGDYVSSLWNFGDEITSTLQNPTHTYTIAGVYTVSLTVSESPGTLLLPGATDTLIRTDYITVYAPMLSTYSGRQALLRRLQ